jgi:hypothetical protein
VARFNTYLRGWLGLLDAKVEGRAPEQFLDDVRGTLDTYPFLYSQRREFVTGATGNVLATLTGWYTPNGTGLRCPSGEVWFVENYSVQVGVVTPLAAAQELRIVLGTQARQGTLGLFREVLIPTTEMLGIEADSPAWANLRPFVMLPGDEFGFWVARARGAGNMGPADLTAHLVRIPI